MTHTYESATQICKAYAYLIGEYTVAEPCITDICIIPFELDQMMVFFEEYKTKDAPEALKIAGYDPKRVRIVVIYEQTFTSPGHLVDLDDYLAHRGIEKVYERSDRSS